MLDTDHYDIERVKDRILEFLAVRRLVGERGGHAGSTVLCFVGPPGVGKTSLGQSIARALGRRFERISVGGVRDEAEIRGHRRTYIGALPGVIIRALRDAESSNPLFMIDEIDKLGADYRGDPASAMLEVLDPEQNATFRDHYLDVPFDLSSVMFVCTANTLDTIPAPLRDRMEVIQLAGYTEDEKLQIAKRYLVPRQVGRNGLLRSQIAFSDAGLRRIIADYTREAGVRNLEREIGAACRKVARRVAEGTLERRLTVTEPRVRELLGRPRFARETKRRTAGPGVAVGLAWTPTGGDVLFVEATAMPGSGRLTLTGQLGDVMRESAQAALSYVRGHASELVPGLPGRLVRPPRRAPARAGGRHAQGRPERRDHDGHRAAVAPLGPAGARRRRDDGRDHADRPGAPDRRSEGEDARRPARRLAPRGRPGGQPGRRRGRARAPAREALVLVGRRGRRRLRRGSRARPRGRMGARTVTPGAGMLASVTASTATRGW